MLKKLSTLLFLAIALTITSVTASAQMTDDAVVAYVKQSMASGKTQNEIAKTLAARGVTKDQAERIKQRFQQEKTHQNTAATEAGAQEYERRENDLNVQSGQVVAEAIEPVDPSAKTVFGRNIFTSRNLTFAPSVNLPTPSNYILGPGDEVIIDIWGTNQANLTRTISQEGTINIPDVGMISLNGMSIKQAESYLKRKLAQIFSLDGDNAKSEIKLSLGSIRTIQVNMMGEVANPGTYYLSSLSNLYHALHRAGGVGPLGSLRNIQLIRKGKVISVVDIYDFIHKGNMDSELILEEGDIINVPAYDIIVDVDGNVRRPMSYEMKKGQTVADLIDYAAGFTGDAYTKNVRMIRKNGAEYQIFTIDEPQFSTFELMEGDSVSVDAMLDRFQNKIEIKGAVYRPGVYELGNDITTVKQFIQKAEGLKGDAFTNRALITRERPDLTLEMLPVDIGAVMNGTAPDVALVKNDILYIPSIHDLKDVGTITVEGQVAKPGIFVYAENTTLEDAIMLAGGLLESASTVKIDINRRVKNPASTTQTDTIGTLFTFAFKDGYVLDGEAGFLLEPYDVINVRRSPGYQNQATVTIYGEAIFPGNYVMTHKEERMSDLVKKAGGLNSWAYVKGARLVRKMTPEEKLRHQSQSHILKDTTDSLIVENLSDACDVAIDLGAALANPGSDADLVLREGDLLVVPEYNNTVWVSGNVMYPNLVTYNPNMTVRNYVDMAGGYGYRSKRSKSYIIYMNGTIKKARGTSKQLVEPGCEIVISKKREKGDALQKILSISTTAASLGTMIATIGNILK